MFGSHLEVPAVRFTTLHRANKAGADCVLKSLNSHWMAAEASNSAWLCYRDAVIC